MQFDRAPANNLTESKTSAITLEYVVVKKNTFTTQTILLLSQMRKNYGLQHLLYNLLLLILVCVYVCVYMCIRVYVYMCMCICVYVYIISVTKLTWFPHVEKKYI